MLYHSITPEEKISYQELFRQIDDNRSGKLSFPEVTEFLINKDPSISEDNMNNILKSMDHNGDNSIDEREFIIFLKRLEKPIDVKVVRDFYNLIDLDGNGKLSKDDLFKF